MLIAIHGNLGSGKTLLMVILGYLSQKNVYANFTIHYPNKKIKEFTLQTIKTKDISNALLLIDEAYILIESRTSHSDINRLMTYILFQSRKKDVDIIISAQLISTLDIRYRSMIDYFILCEKEQNRFKYEIYNINNDKFTFYLSFEKAQQFFKMYNTNQVISNEKINNIADSMLNETEKDVLFKKLKNEIKKKKGIKFSQNLVKYLLIKLGYDINTKLVQEMYLRLQYE